MTSDDKYPININRWKQRRNVPKEEEWKWSFDTWDQVVWEIVNGDGSNINELECPVCGRRNVYAFFVTRGITPASIEMGKLDFSSERWFGCFGCDTQVVDLGSLPSWVKYKDIVWALATTEAEVREKIEKWGLTHLLLDR